MCGSKRKCTEIKTYHLRNLEAFPVVYGHSFHILKRVNTSFVLVEGVKLGEKPIYKEDNINKPPCTNESPFIDNNSNLNQSINIWVNPKDNPEYITITAQKQLIQILESYNGKIPIEHFTNRLIHGTSYFKKGKCSLCGGEHNHDIFIENYIRDLEAYPVVYSYLCNILERKNKYFTLKKGIELGVKNIHRRGFIPYEIR